MTGSDKVGFPAHLEEQDRRVISVIFAGGYLNSRSPFIRSKGRFSKQC